MAAQLRGIERSGFEMEKDLVEQLRWDANEFGRVAPRLTGVMSKAADEIERLRQEADALRPIEYDPAYLLANGWKYDAPRGYWINAHSATACRGWLSATLEQRRREADRLTTQMLSTTDNFTTQTSISAQLRGVPK